MKGDTCRGKLLSPNAQQAQCGLLLQLRLDIGIVVVVVVVVVVVAVDICISLLRCEKSSVWGGWVQLN